MTGRIPILDVQPVIGCGRYPAKVVVGAAALRDESGKLRHWARMRPQDPYSDRWLAQVTPDGEGDWTISVEGWSDPVASWRHTAEVKIPADIDVDLVFAEGAQLMERAAAALPRGRTHHRRLLRDTAKAMRDSRRPAPARLAAAVAADVDAVLEMHPLRDLLTEDGPYPLRVDRERALYGSWYEFFPRSEGARRDADGTWISGTFTTAAQRLPAIAAMGFDVAYLPPIHPIGRTFRKGANN